MLVPFFRSYTEYIEYTLNKHIIAVYGDFTCFLQRHFQIFLNFQIDYHRKNNCSYLAIYMRNCSVECFFNFDCSSLYTLRFLMSIISEALFKSLELLIAPGSSNIICRTFDGNSNRTSFFSLLLTMSKKKKATSILYLKIMKHRSRFILYECTRFKCKMYLLWHVQHLLN